MSSNLKDLIEKNTKANDRILKRGLQKFNNQTSKELELTRRFKKGLIHAAVISALILGVYGANKGIYEYRNYKSQQNKKIAYYQKKFDEVKYYYNNRNYILADKLSETLQGEMGEEWFFSPTNNLYKEVKKYDDEIIDPEIKRIKQERLYSYLRGFPRNVFYRLEEKWKDSTPNERLIVYACGAGLLIYLLRRR